MIKEFTFNFEGKLMKIELKDNSDTIKEFMFNFEEKLISGTANANSEGILETETIELDDHVLRQDLRQDDVATEKDYWSFVDRLCEAFDATKLFDEEVNSIHLM